MSAQRLRVAFYSPADLNLLDGSSIWVQAIAEVLHAGPHVEITLPLKTPERRDVVTRLLRRLDRVTLVDPLDAGRSGIWGLQAPDVLDLIERLDRENRFDVILLRSYELCLLAVERPQLRGRVWSAYVVEPERDITAPEHREGLARIAGGSRRVLVQSEDMRALLETVVPEAAPKTILLPPAIPDGAAPPDRSTVVPRLLYTGKFSALYPVPLMIDTFAELRETFPDLEFHVAGDKFHGAHADPGWARSLARRLSGTPGVVWHGGLSRDRVDRLLMRGGIGLNLWDVRHDLPLNNLVISTKTLDYCAAGLPVLLNRTASHEAMLGADYPLFVSRPDEAREILARVLSDPGLYRSAAEQTWTASRAFTYSAVYARLEPYLARERAAAEVDRFEIESFDRPKLPEASLNLGVEARSAGTHAAAYDILRHLRAADERYRLIVATAEAQEHGLVDVPGDVAAAVSVDGVVPGGMPSWLRKIGFFIAAANDDGALPALASGAIPVVVDGVAASAGDGDSVPRSFSSAADAADAIRAITGSGTWRLESDRARAAAQRHAPSAAATPAEGVVASAATSQASRA